MEDKHLDNIIREKLGQLDVPYQPSTWDALEKRMDAESETEQVFDETIRRKLYGWESNYEHLHWNLLSRKLEAVAIRRILYQYKLTELFLVFLLLFTMGQLLPTQSAILSNQDMVAESEHAIVEDAKAISTKEEKQSILHNKLVETEPTIIQDKHTIINRISKDLPHQPSRVLDRQKASPTLVRTNLEQLTSLVSTERQMEQINDAPIPPLNAPIIPLEVATVDLTLVPLVESSLREASEIIDEQKALQQNMNTLSFPKHEPIAASETGLSPTQQRGRLLNSLLRLSTKQVQPLEQKKRSIQKNDITTPLDKYLLISSLNAVNADYIKRPANATLGTSEYNDLTIGYSSGLSVGWKRGRFSIETGLLYTNKSDSLERRTIYIYGNTQDGYFAESLSNIDFEIFELPIQIQYDVLHKNRWRVYPVLGASMHLANKISYTIERAKAEDLGQSESPGSQKVKDKFLDSSSLSQRPDYDRLSAQQNHDGWQFGKGGFKSNSYFSVNSGVGVSYRLSERCSIFAQSIFKYNLAKSPNGLGPNNDRIHTTSLFVGIQAGI